MRAHPHYGFARLGQDHRHAPPSPASRVAQEQAIVIDLEAEFVQEFYSEERGDVILNPLDERCTFWSPWLEIRDDSYVMDAEALTASLVRVSARTANEIFFRDSGRTLATSIFEVLADDPDIRLLSDFLALPREELHARLAGTRAYAIVDPQAHDQGAGIVATVANALKACYHLPPLEQTTRSWSAREWAQRREGWVFLPCKEDIREAIEPLQDLWLDCLVRWLMSAQIGSEQVWIVADELPAFGYQPQIEKLVTRGRKRGLAVVIGFQNVAQTRAIYGRDGAITLTSSPTTKLIMRSDEPEMARWGSDLIGSHETERLQMTQLAGLSTYREGVNLSPHRSVEHLVLPAEIQQLRPFHGYLCIAGEHRTTVRIPELHLTRRQPDFIPRRRSPAPPVKPPRVDPDDQSDATLTARLLGRSARPELRPNHGQLFGRRDDDRTGGLLLPRPLQRGGLLRRDRAAHHRPRGRPRGAISRTLRPYRRAIRGPPARPRPNYPS